MVKLLTPIKSIKAKCLEYSNGSRMEVKLCPITDCAIYAYRLGKHPRLQGRGAGRNKGINPFQKKHGATAEKKPSKMETYGDMIVPNKEVLA